MFKLVLVGTKFNSSGARPYAADSDARIDLPAPRRWCCYRAVIPASCRAFAALVLSMTLCACGADDEARESVGATPTAAAGPEFPLLRFADGAELEGEKSLPLNDREINRLRGAIGLLERVLPNSDPRHPLLRTTRIVFVEDQGHEKAGGRWDAQGGFIEIGRPTLAVDCLQLIVTLGHEFTHAVNEKTVPGDLNELLLSEVRAYESELPVVLRLRRLLGDLDGLEDDARRYFELTLDRHEVAARTMLRSYQLRLKLVAFASTIGVLHDHLKVSKMAPSQVEFLHHCEMGLAEICLAQRPMTSNDGRVADRILTEFGTFLANTPNLRLNDEVGIDQVIAQLRQKIDEVGQGFRLLAKKEALVAEQAKIVANGRVESSLPPLAGSSKTSR